MALTSMYRKEVGFRTYVCKEHCIVCKHCTDIYYDATNGPYMFFCEFNEELEDCNKFEVDEDVEVVEVDLEKIIEHEKELEKEYGEE